MFESDELLVLSELYPEHERTALQRFVIENEAAFDAFRLLLELSVTGEGGPLPRSVNLVGGNEQLDLLSRLAEENDLDAQQIRLSSGELALVVSHPTTNLSFAAVSAEPNAESLFAVGQHGA
ncbi:hypothetical protein [Variovorax sp. ZT4R33]|uniref:hypothetical protein n=1 Tax=Variovorax sp. ZT4R33 TaxID=3443743 RepID=UPI003F4663D3